MDYKHCMQNEQEHSVLSESGSSLVHDSTRINTRLMLPGGVIRKGFVLREMLYIYFCLTDY